MLVQVGPEWEHRFAQSNQKSKFLQCAMHTVIVSTTLLPNHLKIASSAPEIITEAILTGDM